MPTRSIVASMAFKSNNVKMQVAVTESLRRLALLSVFIQLRRIQAVSSNLGKPQIVVSRLWKTLARTKGAATSLLEAKGMRCASKNQ
jgi:hypothetical protein